MTSSISPTPLQSAFPNSRADWNRVWKEMMAKRQGVAPDSATLWDDERQAGRYWDTVQCSEERRVADPPAGVRLGSRSRVLDIGAGPGTMAVPLSRQASQVTAVEPSQGMVTVLRENLSQRRIHNITCVHRRWEDVDVALDLDPPYDVVIAAFSLDMPDIREAVRKMVRVCSGTVCLYWFAGEPAWTAFYKASWPLLHGIAYPASPKFEVLMGVLRQMGIDPSLQFVHTTFPLRFRSLDQAVDDLSAEFDVHRDDKRADLSSYLEGVLQRDGNTLTIPYSYIAVKLSWKVRTR